MGRDRRMLGDANYNYPPKVLKAIYAGVFIACIAFWVLVFWVLCRIVGE